MTGDDLTSAILGGSEVAVFENLYAAYARDAHATARAFVGDAELAADVVHSAYLEVLRQVLAGRRWDTPDEARGTVHRNVRWAALSLLRRRRLERRPHRVAPEAEDMSADWARSEARSLCEQIVARLPRRDREALTLYYVEGLRKREAAERLGISLHAFESRLSRALRAARESARVTGATPLVAALGCGSMRIARLRRLCRRTLAGSAPLAATAAVMAASWAVVSHTDLRLASRVSIQARAAGPGPPGTPGTGVDTPDDVVAVEAVLLPESAASFAVLGWGRMCQCWVVMRSTDGGGSWSLQRVAERSAVEGHLVLGGQGAAALPHATRGAILQGGGGHALYLMPSQGVMCSTDAGRTWSLRC